MESVIFMKESTPEIHKKGAKKSFSFALITISTSRYEKYGDSDSPEEAEDFSGKAMKELLEAANHEVTFYRLIPDGKIPIIEAVLSALESSADIVITSGGTGLAPKDLTIESITPLFEKELPGFGELFRYKSRDHNSRSRSYCQACKGISFPFCHALSYAFFFLLLFLIFS